MNNDDEIDVMQELEDITHAVQRFSLTTKNGKSPSSSNLNGNTKRLNSYNSMVYSDNDNNKEGAINQQLISLPWPRDEKEWRLACVTRWLDSEHMRSSTYNPLMLNHASEFGYRHLWKYLSACETAFLSGVYDIMSLKFAEYEHMKDIIICGVGKEYAAMFCRPSRRQNDKYFLYVAYTDLPRVIPVTTAKMLGESASPEWIRTRLSVNDNLIACKLCDNNKIVIVYENEHTQSHNVKVIRFSAKDKRQPLMTPLFDLDVEYPGIRIVDNGNTLKVPLIDCDDTYFICALGGDGGGDGDDDEKGGVLVKKRDVPGSARVYHNREHRVTSVELANHNMFVWTTDDFETCDAMCKDVFSSSSSSSSSSNTRDVIHKRMVWKSLESELLENVQKEGRGSREKRPDVQQEVNFTRTNAASFMQSSNDNVSVITELERSASSKPMRYRYNHCDCGTLIDASMCGNLMFTLAKDGTISFSMFRVGSKPTIVYSGERVKSRCHARAVFDNDNFVHYPAIAPMLERVYYMMPDATLIVVETKKSNNGSIMTPKEFYEKRKHDESMNQQLQELKRMRDGNASSSNETGVAAAAGAAMSDDDGDAL